MNSARRLGRQVRYAVAARFRTPSGQIAPGVDGPVNGYEILDKVAELPISTWRYEWEATDVRHLGPMAQDFKATFALGDKDTVIPMVDASGVALVSIQALCRRIADLEHRIAQLEADPAPTGDSGLSPA